MNFIEHFRNWVSLAERDTRLKSHHISLYIALFRYWNENRFNNPFTIYRHEIMALAKIGSINTYTRSLRDLTEWHYIRYEPSFDPQVGSKVHLHRLDKGGDKASDKGSGKAGSKGGDPGDATYNINIPNSPNLKNNINTPGISHEHTDPVDRGTNDTLTAEINSSDDDEKPGNGGRGGGLKKTGEATPETLEEAEAYFLEIGSTAAEATKFFNHYQSNGWRVGGRAPMKDWRAAARNWVINAKKFNHEHTSQPQPGKLSTGPKNYAEPL